MRPRLALPLGLCCLLAAGSPLRAAGEDPPAAPPRAAPAAVRAVQVPMRDGTFLAANVLLPAAPGRYPAIVVQTPYDKDRMGRELGDARAGSEAARGSQFAWARLNRADYAYLFVDWRGFYGSRAAGLRGAARTWSRGQDGYDTVEWTAAQPWCDGRVGTWGGSALGKQQLDTAAERPPHLVCAVPLIAFMGQRYEAFFEGGVRLEAHTDTLDALGFGVGEKIRERPLPQAPAWALARRLTYHPERIDVPCLFVSGWWDHYPREVIETFEDVLARGGDRARAGSALVLGPWAHTAVDLGPQGDLSFPAAEGYSTALTLRFFDRHLRGLTQAWEGVPRVHLFQTGEERWRTGARVADLLGSPTVFALRADGTLAREALPAAPGARPARTYRYDPRSPSPTIGGRNLPPLTYGPKDVASLATRPDVLVWQTAPLAEPLALCGEAEAAFLLAADRPDVDLSLRLCDAFPDGRLLLVGETIQRASLRDPRSVQPLKPGEPVPLRLRLPPHAYTWAAGHRLTLLVTSGSAPRYERNPHTGAPRWDPAAALDVTVTLFAGPGDATLSLPLSPR